MAGIFASIDTDIQKIKQLKAEIENVKKALKQINVKVDIDIAKGMEAQLKSLMGQYDALVAKVSEAEGKIMLSTKRINEASEKIIKAQEQLSKDSGVSLQSSNSNKSNTISTNNAETASVQAQAKAYDELAAEIDAVMGTRTQNIKRMIEEQNAIRMINEEIKKLTQFQSGSSTLTDTQQKRLEQLNNSLLTHKAALSDVRQSLMNNVKLDNAAATSMNALSQSLARMKTTYRELTEEERKSPFGKELLASINQADAKIKELDASIGNHQRNVGNYASGFNGLNMSVQQIVRELPAATMGLNMFFLAISNNLPMLTDEIKRAKTANEELKKSGQKGVPVWKQLASSLFSWQSALMVGITLLSMYGKEIWNWVGSLFGADEAQKRLNESVKDFTSVLNEGQTQARLLFDAVKQTEEGTKGRAEAIEKINAAYGKYLPNLLSEKTSLIELRSAYELVNKALLENAAAKAKASAMDKVLDKSLENQAEAIKGINEIVSEKYGDKYANSIVKEVIGMTDKYIGMGRAKDDLLNMFVINPKTKGLSDDIWDYLKEYVNSVYETNEEIKKIQDKYNPFFDKKKADEAIVQNKEYWSKQREIYVKELEKLSDEEAAEEKGKELKVKIENIDKRLAPYSIQKQQKQDNKPTQDAEEQKQKQEKLYDELLELRFKNQQDEINLMEDGAEKKRRQIELDYQKEIDAYNKAKEKYGDTDEVKQMKINAEDKRKQSLYGVDLEQLQFEKDALNSYLQEYGTFQQRKYAIAQEYADKITKAQTEAEKLKLSKDRDRKIAVIETESLKSGIDWGTVFGEFGGMFSDTIIPVLEDAKKYIHTGEFKNSEASSQQTLIEAVNQMEKTLGGAGALSFKKLGEDVKTYQDALLSLNDAKSEEIEAIEKLKKAQEEYEKALKSGTETEKQLAQEALNTARTNANAASENVQVQTGIVKESQRQVSETSGKLKASMDNVVEGLQKISSGSLTSIYSGLIQAGKGIGGAAAKVSKSLENVPIIGWIVSIIDVFKDGLSNVVGGLLDAVLNAVSGIIGDILSGDLFVTIGESLVKGVSNIFDALTWGGFSKLVKNGDSDKDLEKDTDRLLESNESLRKSIKNLADKMNESVLKDVNDIYDEQINKLNQSIANTQELMYRNADAYSNGFLGIGGHKSSEAKINADMSDNDWNRISNIVGRDINGALDFFSTSPKEMLKVFEQAPDLYSKIKSLADDGYKDAAQYMDEYIDYAKQMEELDTQRKERLTSTTFENVREEFKSTLLDMESDAEDFANNFEKMMQNAAIESLMGNFDAQLKSWYDDFAKSLGDDGELSASEQERLKIQYDDIVNKGLAERDALMEVMGWKSEESQEQQSASSRGFGIEMTHEDVGELSGRFTAVAESSLRVETATQQQTIAITELRGSINSLAAQAQGIYNIGDETRKILADTYLEIQQIRENTGEIIKPIKQIQADIAEVRRNTTGLAP